MRTTQVCGTFELPVLEWVQPRRKNRRAESEWFTVHFELSHIVNGKTYRVPATLYGHIWIPEQPKTEDEKPQRVPLTDASVLMGPASKGSASKGNAK